MKKRMWWASALVAGLSVLLTQSPVKALERAASPVGLADGPGIWVNLWSYPTGDVEAYALKLHNSGIRNVFLQTSRSNTPAIKQPEVLGPLIDACHHYKIRVIAWSFLELGNPEADAQKLIEASKFRSPTGQTFDAVAPNMEKDLDATKVERLSKALRAELGNNYPMIAVVYSPLNKAAQVAKTPWKLLDKYYDVIAPMDYWNSKFAKLEPYSYTRDTVKKVRELCGRPDVEIHIIGDGMKTHGPEIKEFMRACRDTTVTSASLYPFHQMTDEQFQALTSYHDYFPVNSRYRLAAFHELIKSGAMTNVSIDPSKSIPRGEFYRLVANRLTGRTDLQDTQAIHILLSHGVVPDEHRDALVNTPLYLGEAMEHREAYAIVANAVEAKNHANKMGIKLNGHHPFKLTKARSKRGDWFALPAQAQSRSSGNKQMLNYIDAAHIVLSADHDLR